MRACLKLLLCLLSLTATAQDGRPWELLLAEILTAEDMETDEWEDTYDLLCSLEEEPLNLNTVSREELEQLPFLTAQQVEGIMEYLYHYGTLKSMNELRMIRTLGPSEISLLQFFTYVEEERIEERFPRLNTIMAYGNHELMGNIRVPLYMRKGDDNGYVGYPQRHWLRYQFNYKDYVKAGIVGSQDAGEPFFADKNKMGYDFYSLYLQVKHLGRIDNAVVGMFKVSAGMGLVLNNGFSMGKLATLQQMGRNAIIIRPHSSRSQTGYFRGAALTLRLSQQWRLTAFTSYRPLDATLNDDGSISTIVTNGYHRTPAELEKKHNSHATDVGAHIAWRQGGWHIGATTLYTHLSRSLQPQTATLYRRHYTQGNDLVNVSTDYSYQNHWLNINGETAVNRQGALATINSVSLAAYDGLSIMALQRFYSYRYTALYARSLSEGGRVQNESALYLGAQWQPTPRLRLQAYTDYAYFAWARYQVSQSSWAWDNLIAASYGKSAWTLTGRYRLHLRQKDNETKTALTTTTEHRGRLALSWQGDDRTKQGYHSGNHGLSVGNTLQADGVYTSDRHHGFMISNVITLQTGRLKMGAGAGYFNTDDYEARLYVYERSPRYNFSFPSFNGRGLRLHLMAQGSIGRRLTLTAKIGLTHYYDRSTIGTGLQEINSSSQTDIDVQLRYKL